MTVKQLIDKLSKLDGNLTVVTDVDKYGSVEEVTEVEEGERDSMVRCFSNIEVMTVPNAVRIR